MTVLPGLALAVLLALAGEYLSRLIGVDLMGLTRSPVSPILMAIVLGICVAVMVAMTVLVPMKEAIRFEAKTDLDLISSKGALIAGILCVICTLILYVIFSPLVVAR